MTNLVESRPSFCPSLLERMRMCRRTDYTVQDLETMREKMQEKPEALETDPNLMNEIKSTIRSMESLVMPSLSSSSSSKPRSPVVASSPPSSLPMSDEEMGSVSGPSPYTAQFPETTSLHYMTSSLPGISLTQEGRGLGWKKRKIVRLISDFILGDEGGKFHKRRASKTAKVVGHIAGDLAGLIVGEKFRKVGDLIGDFAREGVREVTILGIDNLLRMYTTNTNFRRLYSSIHV